ncbi:hypothetical protein D1007_20597 [Hordeum vulgare]|nr:hypothetical protein D1007_20597 [Hordeum vulgare]
MHTLRGGRNEETSMVNIGPFMTSEENLESSDVHERTTNGEESFTDCDDADADENEDGIFRSNGYNCYTTQHGETNSVAHKNKETLLQNVCTQQGEKTFVANKVTKKTTKGATSSSKSAESGSLSWLGASELPVGTKVFLKSLIKHNRDVDLAIIMSCDPKFKLDGSEIGNEYWVVHVDMALVKTENLVQSRKDCNTLD